MLRETLIQRSKNSYIKFTRTLLNVNNKGKGKVISLQRVGRSIAALFHDHGTRSG